MSSMFSEKPTLSPLENVRQLRNHLLQQSDWTDLPHAPLSESQKQRWQAYRQRLRDLTNSFDPLKLPEWPVPPQ